MTEIQVSTKDFTSRKSDISLYKSTTERLPLIHSQITLTKSVESNKFDNVDSKI